VAGAHKITKFAKKYAASRKALARFVELADAAEWGHFEDLKQTFRAADYAPKNEVVIFDIGGNNYRLIATVNYELQILLIEEILTHEEYSKRKF
jgi:mRNA interferase HigB